jgi:hypothetical protein
VTAITATAACERPFHAAHLLHRRCSAGGVGSAGPGWPRSGLVSERVLRARLLSMGVGSIFSMPMTAFLSSRFGCRQVITASAGGLCLILPVLRRWDRFGLWLQLWWGSAS